MFTEAQDFTVLPKDRWKQNFQKLSNKGFLHDLYPTDKVVKTDKILLQCNEKGGTRVTADLVNLFFCEQFRTVFPGYEKDEAQVKHVTGG